MLAAVAFAYLLAGFVKGVIGLGLPTVAIGVLGLMMTPAQAAAILVVPSLVTNVWQALAGGGVASIASRLWPMLFGIFVGTFIAAALLPPGGSANATGWLGGVLVIYALLGLSNIHFRVAPRNEGWVGFVIGIATGAVAVPTGVFAIPSAPFIQALKLDRDQLVQALGLSFTVSTIAMALALAHAGEMQASLVLPTLTALVTAIAGMKVGQIVRGLVKAETFRLLLYIGLLALGAHLALRALI